jgi:aminopeptidase
VPAEEQLLEPELRARYADVIVRAGVVVHRGDLLVVRGQREHRELLLALAEAAYRRGARHVQLEIDDPLFAATRFRAGGRGALGEMAPWARARARALMEHDAAIVHVAGEGEPEAFAGIEPRRLAEHSGAVLKALSWYQKASLAGRVRWTIAGWPAAAWAADVYPELEPLEGKRRLAHDLVWFCRASEEDGAGAAGWERHVRTLEKRSRALGRLGLTRLELRGEGTELDLGLPPDAIWRGGREKTSSGRLTSPNMPTEEVFTSPRPAATEGTFRCSRPLVFHGRTIEGIAGEFRGGRLVRLEAAQKEDRELLAAFLDTDRNARRLGEIALVDSTSRIGQTGRVYFNTLLDENAAAHIAFGAGFPDTRPPGGRGVNRSDLHLDVMIGTDDFEVTGVTEKGRRVPLIAGGRWQI